MHGSWQGPSVGIELTEVYCSSIANTTAAQKTHKVQALHALQAASNNIKRYQLLYEDSISIASWLSSTMLFLNAVGTDSSYFPDLYGTIDLHRQC